MQPSLGFTENDPKKKISGEQQFWVLSYTKIRIWSKQHESMCDLFIYLFFLYCLQYFTLESQQNYVKLDRN